MSTELLTRRMDLIHTIEGTNHINYLTMDTSYPVKVKGIILKEYIATSTRTYDYSSSAVVFCVRNQNNETVGQFTRDQCFNFDGDRLDSLPAIGEYVMALIDLDANKIFIAPTNEIGGGSYKQFKRKIFEMDSTEQENDADPIIDMKSINPTTFYGYSTREGSTNTKNQYPEEYYTGVTAGAEGQGYRLNSTMYYEGRVKTKKGKASTLVLTQKKRDGVYSAISQSAPDADQAALFFLDISSTDKHMTASIDPQPTLYAGMIEDDSNTNANYFYPVDTNAPGTVKMYSIDLDREIEEIANAPDGTAYNLLARAASIQQNNCMNYSLVRDNEDLVVYQFYPYSPQGGNGGFALAPVADVTIDDLNRLQSNVAVCAFMTPNADSGYNGSYYSYNLEHGYATILATQAVVQTIGNLSEKFRDRYAIPYSSDPASAYQSIRDKANGSNPLRLTPYPGEYFRLIEDLNEVPKYYLVVACTDSGAAETYDMQNIKFVPVRDVDNYFSITSQKPVNIKINKVETEINIEGSEYAPYITTFWWGINANGTRNYGFDILTNPSNNHLHLGGAGYNFFGSNSDQYPELSSTIDPFDKTIVASVTEKRHCTATYKMSDAIIEEIKTATGISEANCKTIVFNFKVIHISKDIEDIVYKLDDNSHGITFTSNVQLEYEQNNVQFKIGTNLTSPAYTFEYEISNFDVVPYFINANDDGRTYYTVRKLHVEYPHMVNFDTKEILYETMTFFILQRFTRAEYAQNGNPGTIIRPINVVDNAGVLEMHVDTYQLYEDNAYTTIVTKSMYETYKTAGIDKKLYYYNGQNDDAHKTSGWSEFEITIHFSPASPGSTDIQQNDVFSIETIKFHRWNSSTSTWEVINGNSNGRRDKYDIKPRSLRLFPYSASQVVPSSNSFYVPYSPYPRVPNMGVFPPAPDTQYGVDFQKWFKTIDCWKLFDSNETAALQKMAMYNRGIDEKFIYTDSSKTKYRSLYDFMYDLFTKDVGCGIPGQYDGPVDDTNRNFESIKTEMSFFDATTAITWQAENTYATSSMYAFYVASDHPHGGIDTYLREKSDPTIDYSVNESSRINVAKVTTGLKKVTALSLTDENGDKLLLTGTGIDLIEADTLNWKDLLLGLSSNRSVDLCGPLTGLKNYAKSNRKISEPNRQSTTGYALLYNSDGTSSGMTIEGYDRYNWAKAFWSDPMMMDLANLPAYWYINANTGSTTKVVQTILPVICPILGASFKGLSDIATKYLDGDSDPVRYEVFMFKTSKVTHDATRIAFDEINTEDGLIERLDSLSIVSPIVYIAGHPARIEIDTTNHRFYIKSGFQEILNKKVFYHYVAEREEISGTVEGRKSPLATGFFKISGHHSSSTASTVNSVFSTSDSKFSNDYVDGLYYATVEEGILRSTTRVLSFRWDDTIIISGSDTGKVPIYNPSASGYSGLYTDTTIDSNDGKEFVCEFDSKGRITSMTVVGSDPTF